MTISNIESDSLQKYKSASSALAKRLAAMEKTSGMGVRSTHAVDNSTGVHNNVDVQETQTASFAQMLSKILAANDAKQIDNTEKAGADSDVFSMQSLQGAQSVMQRVVGGWE